MAGPKGWMFRSRDVMATGSVEFGLALRELVEAAGGIQYSSVQTDWPVEPRAERDRGARIINSTGQYV